MVAVAAIVVLIAAACDFQGTWGTAVTTPDPAGATASADLNVVSCVPSGACVAAGRAAAVRTGSTWTSLPTPPAEISSLACAAVDDCLGGWATGPASPPAAIYHFDGSSWSATNWPTTVVPKAISCPSATTCLAVGQSATGSVAQRWNGSTFATTTLPVTSIGATGVSCSSTTFCMAVGSDNVGTGGPWAAKWNGAAWTTVATSNLTASLDRVSCLSSTLCYASVAPSYLFQLATWTGTTLVGGTAQNFQDFVYGWGRFACGAGSPNRCFGLQGNTETRSSSITGLVTTSAGLNLGSSSFVRDISCAAAANCVAVGVDSGGSHAAWHFDGTSWSADSFAVTVQADAHLDHISCPSATFCMAIGTYAHGTRRRPYTLVWNGTTWAAPANPLPFAPAETTGTEGTDVTCLSATFCAATLAQVDDLSEFPTTDTTLATWNGTTWTGQPGTAPLHLACFSPTSCVGLDRGSAYTWDGTAVTSRPSTFIGTVDRISCATPTRCVATLVPSSFFTPGALVSWDGTTVTTIQAPAPAGQAAVINDISCVGSAPTRCVAVGAVGPTNGYPTTTGGSPYVLVGDGLGTWTAASLPVTGPGSLQAVSCPDTAECLTIGTGSVAGTPRPGLVLGLTVNTWKVAPDLPAGPSGPVTYEDIACAPAVCNVIGPTGPPFGRSAVAAPYRWTYS